MLDASTRIDVLNLLADLKARGPGHPVHHPRPVAGQLHQREDGHPAQGCRRRDGRHGQGVRHADPSVHSCAGLVRATAPQEVGRHRSRARAGRRRRTAARSTMPIRWPGARPVPPRTSRRSSRSRTTTTLAASSSTARRPAGSLSLVHTAILRSQRRSVRYGHFDDDAREYVITRPDTPLPWINYLGSEDFFGLISNTAGGYSFYRDARLRRLTRYRYNNAPARRRAAASSTLRDDDDRRLLVARPGSRPSATSTATRAATASGYTIIGSRPRRASASRPATSCRSARRSRSWRMRAHQRAADAAPTCRSSAAVEFCLWDAQDDATNFQRNSRTGEVEVDGRRRSTTRPSTASGATTSRASPAREPVAGFDTSARGVPRAVPGLGPAARGRARRAARARSPTAGRRSARYQVAARRCAGRDARGHLRSSATRRTRASDKFDPPGSGSRRQATARAPVIARYLRPRQRRRGLRRRSGGYWDGPARRRSRSRPPNAHVGPDGQHLEPVPVHGHVQPVALRLACSSRASAAAWASATRTRTCSASCTWSPSAPGRRILDIAATQLPDGGAYHQYQPLTKRGNDDIGLGLQRRPALAGARASRPTSRRPATSPILDEPVPWDNGPGSETPLYDHLRALHRLHPRAARARTACR